MKILGTTQSICPVCRMPLEGRYVSEAGSVILTKTCEAHGIFETAIAQREEDYLRWTANPSINIPPKKAMTQGVSGSCPLHCGTCNEHLQTACCVLIDITERCNQHCPYCFAKAETDLSGGFGPGEPDLEEIRRKYDLLLDLGEERAFNIQLSGGEPTVRNDLPDIIRMGKSKGFEFIQINTNGRRIAQEEGYAQILKDAGASVAFLQFDGTDDEIYRVLRGEPLLELKKKAVENCRKAGLPVTLVPTVVRDVNLKNIGSMMDFLLENVDVVKGIHFQPVSFFGRHPGEKENRVTMFDVMNELEQQTKGAFAARDCYPITTGHPLCCFQSSYQKQKDGTVKSLINYGTKMEGLSCCEAKDPLEIIKKDRDFVLNKWHIHEPYQEQKQEESCCCNNPAESEDRSGKSTETCCCGSTETFCESTGSCGCDESSSDCCSDSHGCGGTNEELLDFDQFLNELRRNMFSVSCMAFMDGSNLDAERLKRCRVQVLSPDDRLIPFCAYNSIYREDQHESI